MTEVIRQRSWTKKQLRAAGFQYFERRKELIMVRELPAAEAPKQIVSSCDEPLVVEAGYMICYSPGKTRQSDLDAYEQWPVEPEIFDDTYSPWDETAWKPTPAVKHLMKLGCQPYYKSSGVWAKKVDEPCTIQSLESEKPFQVEIGWIVVIGVNGEPYSMTEDSFTSRYQMPQLVR